MLRNNVMSFMKKMGMAQQEAGGASVAPDESGKTLSKILQLGNIITAGNVTKPAKVTPVEDIQPKEDSSTIESLKPKSEAGGKTSSGDDCRVCRKSFGPEEVSRTCCECQHKVCEDCASYSTTTNSDDPSSWRCSVCRRKIASRDQPIVTQESTDSMLDVPTLETLHRRHSDARLGPTGSQIGALGSGLAPPRSPEIRRHSDVSPASLKELEKFRKVAGERQREELKWERDLDRKSKSRGGSPDRHQASDRGRATSPQRVVMPAQTGAIEQEGGDLDDEEERRRRARRGGGNVRRKSRVTRQRSYDDEIKTAAAMAAGGAQPTHPDTGLGLPVQLPRRASAYDVYAVPGSSGLNAMAIAAAQQRASISAQGTREPEERPAARRSSFRAVKPVMPYDAADDEKMIKLDSSSAPAVVPPVSQPVLVPDEERRNRRRGSQLPDINAIRALTSTQPGAAKGAPAAAVSRVAAEDRELPRQGSLVDGEGIKIVIHDVDSDLAPRINAKRRVKLRRDPVMDKGHRTRGFGMRVVGGKTGSDGRTFACIVWTVPGGPAEKAGLQQGDKVLEWSGVSLIDRSFEEVQQIIERTDDVAELVVEHTTEITGDLLDDPQAGKTPTNLGLLMETETDKAPSSPTRRKLPKTPEQIAKERQVTGRVQIQVSYEAERKELVVSVFMADDLCTREDTGFGTLPEAFAKLILAPPSGDATPLKTIVAEPTQKPIWNATLFFTGVDGESLMERAIEVTLWDYCPDGDNVFLGECTVDVQRALENDRAVWYRLEDPRGLRTGKSPYCSPRGSVSMDVAQRLFRKELRDRSYSDDTQSDSGSPEFCFLHPDHAWHANSRRGSSQSEQLEVEPYELSRDYSRSLPGSRRSSFQSQGGTDSKRGSMGEADMPSIVHYNRDRRRSSFTRPMRDPEEILEGLRALKATKGELSRTMSLSGDKRRGSRRGERKDSVMEIPERFYDRNSESDEDEKWRSTERRSTAGLLSVQGNYRGRSYLREGYLSRREGGARYLREDVLARTRRREVAAEAQDPRGATLEDPAVSADAEIRTVRDRAGQALAGDAVGEEAGLREQPGSGRRRSGSRSPAAEGIHLRLVSALPDPHPRHEQRGLSMMVKGKMGPRGWRARPQTEPFAQGRGRVRRQDHLLMEIVADYVAMSAGSNPMRSRSRRDNGIIYFYKSLNIATRLTLFQKANEVRVDQVNLSIFLCCCDFSIATYISNILRMCSDREKYFHISFNRSELYYTRALT